MARWRPFYCARKSTGLPGITGPALGAWTSLEYEGSRRETRCALRNARGAVVAIASVTERDSDMGGGAVYHDNRVQVEKSR